MRPNYHILNPAIDTIRSFGILTACLIMGGLSLLSAQPVAEARRTEIPVSVNGLADDPVWAECPVVSTLVQYDPAYGARPMDSTRVRFAFDDQALYVLAEMNDPDPGAILVQLGERDNENLNADYFQLSFDTYHNQADAYYFKVTASGVQSDWRESDELFDGVWRSEVRLSADGWVAELRLPWSVLRFPRLETQEWGLQITRYIRRNRETNQWALEVRESGNTLIHWGLLKGIQGVDPPLRLSVMPYASVVYERAPVGGGNTRDVSQINGGVDLKFGINEAYTLDVTLLPDFSQVKSDDEIKNLSAFETTYDENRQFFREGTELFGREDLFYSRRIGRRPGRYDEVASRVDSGGRIVSNPTQVNLINALKVSGRNSKGLALGMFNAITDRAVAVLEDGDGQRWEMETEPFANYNIMVADRQFRRASEVWMMNTNVTRGGNGRNANVTAAGFELRDRSNTFKVEASSIMSNIYPKPLDGSADQPSTGFRHMASVEKESGKLQGGAWYFFLDDKYDINDLGLNFRNNNEAYGAEVAWKIFEPFGYFRKLINTVGGERIVNQRSGKNEVTYFYYSGNSTLKNYLTLWWGANWAPFERYDYYEPRTPGRFYLRPGYLNGNLGFSSDYRKPLALDGGAYLAKEFGTYRERNLRLSPIIRFSNRLSGQFESVYNLISGAPGFVTRLASQEVIYGMRRITTYENSLSALYMFNARIGTGVWFRHYWRTGEYSEFFTLLSDGFLNPREYTANPDFSFNSFNIDLSLRWEFAPGSLLTLMWKNAILDERPEWDRDFADNLSYTLRQDHWNTLSLKFIYYLDYRNTIDLLRHKPS
ncbi:MAG TPA: DUF5916 domain-containing protein [Bacteroidales bacterium]|nr:DUF5916 domain-containing protein [Bacteroidales bacterium]